MPTILSPKKLINDETSVTISSYYKLTHITTQGRKKTGSIAPKASKFCSWTSEYRISVDQWASDISPSNLVSMNVNVSLIS